MALTIRIGHLSTFYHTSILLIAGSEVQDTLGNPVAWELFSTGPSMVEAFRNGELDLGYIGLPPAMIGIASDVTIRCIAGGHIEGTVIVGRSDLRGYPETENLGSVLDQFKGHRIGVPGKGSIHDVILADCLQKHGLQEEIEVVNFRWADQITDSLARGEVSAAFGTPALAIAAKHFSESRLLWPASRLWPDNPSYGIVADTGFMKDHGEVVEKFLLLHENASAVLRDRPGEAARKIAGLVGIVDKDFVAETIALSPHYCAQLSEGFVRSTMEFSSVMKRLGYLNETLGEENIFDFTHIRNIHQRGHHY